MHRYIIKRIIWMVPVLLIVTLIVFSIVNLTPGDIPRVILGSDAPQSAVEQLRIDMQLDKPLLVRFVSYIRDVVFKGDLGTSYRTGSLVAPQIASRFPISFKLSILAMMVAISVGIPFGIIAAVKQGTIIDNIVSVIALFFAAIPPFWFALMAMYIFALKLNILPTNGLDSPASYILPVLTIAIPAAAELMRLTRSSMLESIRADYVKTARAKGISEYQVIVKHSLKNALLPIITQVGMTFGIMFGNCAMSEIIFVIPGTGRLILDSVTSKDVPVTTGTVLWLSIAFAIIMLVVDLLYAYIDPRIKTQYKSTK